MLHVFSCQNPFSLVLGADKGIDGNPVQSVKEVRNPGHGTVTATVGMPYAEMDRNFFCFGNWKGRAINGQHPKLLPSPVWEMIVEEGDQRLAQFNERLVTKFSSGLGESALGDISLGYILPMDSLEEIIQLILDGAFDEIGEEKDHVVEWQAPLADEVSWRSSVPFQKRRRKYNFFKNFDKIGTHFQKQVPCQLRTSFQCDPAWWSSSRNRVRLPCKQRKYITSR